MLAFIHIPKVAGASIIDLLREVYGESLYWHGVTYPYSSFRGNAPTIPTTYKAVCGHLTLPQMELIPAEKQYFAFVRDPVERVISWYLYISRTPRHSLHRLAKNEDLETFLDRCLEASKSYDQDSVSINAQAICNDQCYYLSGKRQAEAAIRAIDQHRILVAPLSDLVPTIAILNWAFGWNKELKKLNSSTGNYPISEDVYSRIARLNMEDHILYDFVLKRKQPAKETLK